MKLLILLSITTLTNFIACFDGHSTEITVAVASNFTAPMKAIGKEFERQSKHRVNLASSSSGKLYAQIKNGAPFDLFLSADSQKADTLISEGFVTKQDHYTYAIGRLVLWSKIKNYVDKNGDILKSDKFKKIAIANPKLAPYGLAAKETMEKLGLYQKISEKIVLGENISQTLQFIITKNAQLGFIALSQIIKESEGSYWIVPENLHTPILQDILLLKKSAENKAARELFNFIRSKIGQKIIASYGYKIDKNS